MTLRKDKKGISYAHLSGVISTSYSSQKHDMAISERFNS